MATLNLYNQVKLTANGEVYEIGQRGSPYTLTVTGRVHRADYSLASGSTKVVLDLGASSTSDLASFVFFYLISTQALMVETQGAAATANSNQGISANFPYILSSDNTLAYSAAGGFAGAANDITKITVSNSSGSTATIQVFAVL